VGGTSRQSLFVWCTVIIITLSVFCGAYGLGTFTVGGVITSPSAWDVITAFASSFFGLLTFSFVGVAMPVWLSIIFWLITFIWIYSIIDLIRG
jgi:hypothetical protein